MLLTSWLRSLRSPRFRSLRPRRRAGSRALRTRRPTVSGHVEHLEDRTLLSALIFESLDLTGVSASDIRVNNADVSGFDSIVINSVVTDGEAIDIDLSSLTSVRSIVIESVTISGGGEINVNLDGVTGLESLVIDSVNVTDSVDNATNLPGAGLNISLSGGAGIGNLAVFDSTLSGISVTIDGGTVTRGGIIANTIRGGVGVPGLSLTADNAAVFDNFTIADNQGISSATEDSILLDINDSPVDGLTVRDNLFATSQAVRLDFLIDGDTFSQPFSITNNSLPGQDVTRFLLDVGPAGLEFDIDPTTGRAFTVVGGTDTTTGFQDPADVDPRGTTLELNFDEFEPGETFQWNIDLDHAGAETSVFGSDLIGSVVTVEFSGGQVVTGTLVAVEGQPDAARFVPAQGSGGGTGINVGLENSPLTNLLVHGNLIEGNSGFGVLFDARRRSDIQGTISQNTINATAEDGVRFQLADSDFTGTVVNNAIGANAKSGIAFQPSVELSGRITGASSGTPIVITSAGHGLQTGDRVVIDGVAGVNTTTGRQTIGLQNNANGAHTVTVIDANRFRLDGTTANAVYTGGGTWFKTAEAGNVSAAVRATLGLPVVQITSANHGLTTGDKITITGLRGNLAANGTHSVTVVDANTFTLDGTASLADESGTRIGTWFRAPVMIDLESQGTFARNQLSANTGAGVSIVLPQGTAFDADFHANQITNNDGMGIDLLTTAGVFDIRVGSKQAADGNEFQRNVGAGLGMRVLDTGSGSFEVVGNTFTSQQNDSISAIFNGDAIHARMAGSQGSVAATSSLVRSLIEGNVFGVDNLGNDGSGVVFTMQESTVIDDLLVSGNTFVNNDRDGFRFSRRDDALMDQVRILNNTFEGQLGDGIDLFAQNTTNPIDTDLRLNFVLTGNEITNNAQYGMRVQVEADARIQLDMEDNTVDFNGRNAAGFHPADDPSGGAGNQGASGGIGLRAFQQVEVFVDMRNNRVRNNTGDGFSTDASNFFDTLAVTGTWENNEFVNNSLSGVRQHGTAFGRQEWTDNRFEDNGEDGARIVALRDPNDQFNRYVGGSDIDVRAVQNTFVGNANNGLHLGQGISAHLGDGTAEGANLFQQNGVDGLRITQGSGMYLEDIDRSRHITIDTNFFLENGDDGIDIGQDSDSDPVMVVGNPDGTDGRPETNANPALGNFLHGDEPVTNTQVVVNNSIIFRNEGDGIEYLAESSHVTRVPESVQLDGRSLLDVRNSRITFNAGRGIDVLNRVAEDSQVFLFNNNVSSNRLEGVYIVNTASATQEQNGPEDELKDDGYNVTTPNIDLRMRENIIESNGNAQSISTIPLWASGNRDLDGDGDPDDIQRTRSSEWHENRGTSEGTLGGLVIRVGTVDGSQSSGTFAQSGPEAAQRDAESDLFGSGIDAEIINNSFDGNFGSEVYFDMFTSSIAPLTLDNWHAGDDPDFRIFNFVRNGIVETWSHDPLARLDLDFRGNTGNTLDVINGYTFYDNRESEFKSRHFRQSRTPNHDHNPLNPLGIHNDDARRRNAARTRGENIRIFEPEDDEEPGDFVFFWGFDGWGPSTWRVELGFDTSGFANTSPAAGFSDFDDEIRLTDFFGVGELPFVWDTGGTSTSLSQGDIFAGSQTVLQPGTETVAPDRFEENDSFVSAHDFGLLTDTISESGLNIDVSDDDDFFKFTTPGFTGDTIGTMSIDLAFLNRNGNLELELYEIDPNAITEEKLVASSTTTGDGEQIAGFQVKANTTYIVRVFGARPAFFGKGATNTDYTLTIEAPIQPDRFEPNETFATATDLGVLGSRTEPGLTIHRPSTIAPTTAVIQDREPNNSIFFPQNLDFANWDLGFSDNIGDFTTNTSTTIPHVTIQGSGDGTFDFYSFTVANAGDRAIFDIDFGSTGFGTAGSMDTELFLFDSFGNLLDSNDDSSPTAGAEGSTSFLDSYIEWTFAAPGRYIIAVGEFPSSEDPLDPGTITGETPDPGDTYTLQVSLENHPASPGRLIPGDVDVYSFIANTTGTATVDLLFTHADGNLELEFYDSAQTLLASSTSTDDDEQVTAAVTGGETYFVRVFADIGQVSPDYTLSIDVVEALPLTASGPAESQPTGRASGNDATDALTTDGLVALTASELTTIVDAAAARWTATGLAAEQVALLEGITVQIADLSGMRLASASGSNITIDADGAGFGWFIDSTPLDDVEYATALATTRLVASADSDAYGRMDLLTAVLHEMGHVLGLEDLDPALYANDLMANRLATGERRLPADGQADGADPSDHGGVTHFLAAPITVNSTADGTDADPGDGQAEDSLGRTTLRAAVMEANASANQVDSTTGQPVADVVNLPVGTYTLTLGGRGEDAARTGDLDITESLSIIGSGAATIIDADALDRIFHVHAGVTLTLSNLTIRGGEEVLGGGILNEGMLILQNVEITDNSASTDGGGIYNDGGDLTIDETVISSNVAGSDGGGIYNARPVVEDEEPIPAPVNGTAPAQTTGTVQITGSTIESNEAGVRGGGIFNAGEMTIFGGAITANEAFAVGGGIANEGTLRLDGDSADGIEISGNTALVRGGGLFNAGDATIVRATFDQNTADSRGGGLFNVKSTTPTETSTPENPVFETNTVTILNSTFSANESGSRGGGLFNEDVLNVSNSTISANRSVTAGGGVLNEGRLEMTNVTIALNEVQHASGVPGGHGGGVANAVGATASARNTIFVGNLAESDPDVSGTFVSRGNNLIGDIGDAGGFVNFINNDQVGGGFDPEIEFVDVLLPLDNYGGPTLTHFLPLGSPARDAGSSQVSETQDQRGRPRSLDGDGNNVARIDIGAVEANQFTVTGRIWEDLNRNGLQDPGEPGIANVQVLLLDAGPDGQIGGDQDGTRTNLLRVTDSSGRYTFSGLDVGTYYVDVSSIPPGTVLTQKDAPGGTNQEDDRDSDVGDNSSANDFGRSLFTLIRDRAEDAGLISQPGGVTGIAWRDDGNGTREPEEPGIANVVVELFSPGADGQIGTADDVRIGTPTMTDGTTGRYTFNGISVGDYYVRFVAPSGRSFADPNQGGDERFDSDADPLTGRTALITVPANQTVDFLADAGLVDEARIEGRAWLDLRQSGQAPNGIRDDGDPAKSGVEVKLFRVGDDEPQATTTTDANGRYEFGGLAAGTYFVQFTKEENFAFTIRDAGNDDAVDSDADPLSGRTAEIVVQAGSDELNWDAGLVTESRLGDRVWEDKNRDGIQGDPSSEPGVDGIPVELHHVGNDGQIGTADDVLVATTTTVNGGQYSFPNLAAGQYYLTFANPAGFGFTRRDAGDDANDSDADPQTGRTGIINLAAETNDLSWDAGLVQLASVGNLVWRDQNADGIRHSSEPGVADVEVKLFQPGADGRAGGGDDVLVRTTRTVAGGQYLFQNVDPGSYYVQFTAPSGLVFTPERQQGNDNLDSDAERFTGSTRIFTLAAGAQESRIDAGLVTPAQVGNFAWSDTNGDGIQQSGEPGLAGVGVDLFFVGPDGAIGGGDDRLIRSTTTSSSGFYSFQNLPPGRYYINFVEAPGFAFTVPNAGSNDSVDSDPDAAGLTAAFTLGAGETNTRWDAGLVPHPDARVGDLVWEDFSRDGIQQADEPGVAGVQVQIFSAGGNGQIGGGDDVLVKTTTTNARGRYLFTNLAPGEYYVAFGKRPEPGKTSIFTTANAGSDEARDSDVNPASGMTEVFVLAQGELNRRWDAGLVSAPDRPSFSNPAEDLTVADDTPELTWSGIRGADSYDVLIYHVASGREVFRAFGVSGTSVVTTALGNGRHQAFIRAVNVVGNSGWASPRHFTIQTQFSSVPQVTGPPSPTSDTTPEITWTAVAGASSYELLVYNKQAGQQLFRQAGISTESFQVTQPLAGNVTYEVFVRAAIGSGVSSWSAPGYEFTVQSSQTSAPVRPTLVAPTGTTGTQPTFEWTLVANADSYQLLVYHAGREVINATGLTGNTFVPSSPLQSGEHEVFIRAFNSAGASPFGGPIRFVVSGSTSALTAPTLTAPGSTTGPNPSIAWTSVSGAQQYEIQIYDTNAGRLVRQYAVLSSTTQFSVPSSNSLANGNYQVFVRATNSAGGGPWSQPRSFQVAEATPATDGSPAGELDRLAGGDAAAVAEAIDRLSLVAVVDGFFADLPDDGQRSVVRGQESEQESPPAAPGGTELLADHGRPIVHDPSLSSTDDVDAVMAEWPELDWWNAAASQAIESSDMVEGDSPARANAHLLLAGAAVGLVTQKMTGRKQSDESNGSPTVGRKRFGLRRRS